MSDPSHSSRLRLFRSSARGAEVTVHQDGRLQPGDDIELDPATRALTEGAADIVASAQERAEEVLRDGVERATTAELDATRQGHERGYIEGRAAARAELADALALVQAIALDARALRDGVLRSVEQDMVELVVASVEAILGEQVKLAPELALDSVERALRRAGSQNVMRIRVHPQDRDLVSARLGERAGDAAAGWEVSADGAISVGGCVIDTEAGEIDARLDVQLGEIARHFRALSVERAGPAGEQLHAG